MTDTAAASGRSTTRYDVVVVGGGHNALVAATYLARAGLRTLVLERLDRFGGAAASEQPFPGVDARLSVYSYLVSLLPDALVTELGLRIELRSRAVASYTPVLRGGHHEGLLVEHEPGRATEESFRTLTGGDGEYDTWRRFYGDVADVARAVSPGLTEPLRTRAQLADGLEGDARAMFDALTTRSLGDLLLEKFTDDVVRGVVATDGLIGTFADLEDPELLQNRCFLYHLIGNGTGEWRVPVGGMGAVSAELERVAREAGAHLVSGAEVTRVSSDGSSAQVHYLGGDGERDVSARYLLSGVAPARLAELGLGDATPAEGSQLKVNVVLTRLPRLRSGIDPATAFAGTFHVDESYDQLQAAYEQAEAGTVPETMPAELYCHTLTDPSILGPELSERGWQTLTMFGVHTPARLFGGPAREADREEAKRRIFAGLQRYLDEPLDDCIARDSHGEPCVEVKDPYDIEAELGMPGGQIFHADLSWPWLDEPASAEPGPTVAAERWGVALPGLPGNVLVCGSGARRGGAVSGLGGHNAAQAVLEAERG